MQTDQPVKPANIVNIVATNQGRLPLTLSTPVAALLSVTAVNQQRQQGHIIVDTRSAAEFGAGHIPGAYNVQLASAEFEQRVGWVTPPDVPIILVAEDEASAQRAIFNMAFVALDSRVVGALDGGMSAWLDAGQPLATVPQIDIHTLAQKLSGSRLRVLDVRDVEEWDEGHIETAVHMNFKLMQTDLGSLTLPPEDHIAVVCGGGMRSSTASSILKMNGYPHIYNVTGGMDAWRAARLPMIDGDGMACTYGG